MNNIRISFCARELIYVYRAEEQTPSGKIENYTSWLDGNRGLEETKTIAEKRFGRLTFIVNG